MTAQYQLQLTTITPVCIGTGTKLSPYADYVIDERHKKIYYIDQELVKRKLAQNVRLVDDYVAGVATGMDNNRSSFNVDQFLRTRLGIDVKTQHRLQLDCEATGSKELYTIVKNAGRQPYIPGSSLKGAVKTALLYDWLINSEEGNQWIHSFAINLKNHARAKVLENQLESIARSFEKLSFSDSTFFETDSIIVLETKRIKIGTGEDTIPQVLEALLESKSVRCKLAKPKQYCSVEKILRTINKFSIDNNRKELQLLTQWGQYFKKDYFEDYEELVGFHKEINEKIQEAKPEEAYMRIGTGKGYFFNSIGAAIANYRNGHYFETFLRQYGKGYKFRNAAKFPITRLMDISEFKPLGWIKLELVK